MMSSAFMMWGTAALKLRDGRLLCYHTAGFKHFSPAGQPAATSLLAQTSAQASSSTVLYHHGWPSSGTEAKAWHPAAVAQNVQIIAVDRPGIGRSTLNPRGSLTTYAQDVADLLQHLGLNKVIHIGTSGGGPYACACAALQPQTTAALGLVASMTHCAGPGSLQLVQGMDWFNRMGYSCIAYAPSLTQLALTTAAPAIRLAAQALQGLCSASVQGIRTPATATAQHSHVSGGGSNSSGNSCSIMPAGLASNTSRLTSKAVSLLGKALLYAAGAALPGPDRKVLLQQPAMSLQVLSQSLAGAFRQGAAGVFDDMRLTTLPWDFSLGSIRAPTVVFQGDADVNVTVNMAQWLGAQIPGAAVLLFPAEAHFSLVVNHAPEVLSVLKHKRG